MHQKAEEEKTKLISDSKEMKVKLESANDEIGKLAKELEESRQAYVTRDSKLMSAMAKIFKLEMQLASIESHIESELTL